MDKIWHNAACPYGTSNEPGEIKHFVRKLYPGSKDGIEPDLKHPKPYEKEVHSIVYYDASFPSDKVTRRSTTGVVLFASKIPVLWVSKRQGAIATSTYSAELPAGKTEAE